MLPTALREEKFRKKKKGCSSSAPSSTNVAVCSWLKLCGHRRKSILADINDPCLRAGLDSCR